MLLAQQARQQLATRRQEALTASQQLSKAQAQARSQQALRQAEGGGLEGRKARRKVISEIGRQRERVRQAEKQLTKFEREQLIPQERQIRQFQEAQKEAAEAKADLQLAKEIVQFRERPTSDARTSRQRKFVKLLTQGKDRKSVV